MVLVVVRDDQVIFRGYGETAPNSHQLPTQDSVLRLCSLTKIFTTDVLAKLAADKTVQLDDPLQLYAPKGTIVPKRVRPITLESLATHTSGLPRELGNAPLGTPHFTFPDYRHSAGAGAGCENQRLRSTARHRRALLECCVRSARRRARIRCTQAICRTARRTHAQPAAHAGHHLHSHRRAMQSSADRCPRRRSVHNYRADRRSSGASTPPLPI